MFSFDAGSFSKGVLLSALFSIEVRFLNSIIFLHSLTLGNMTDQLGLGISVGEFECTTRSPGWMVFTWMLYVRCSMQQVFQYSFLPNSLAIQPRLARCVPHPTPASIA